MRTIRFVCAALWFFSSRLFAQHYLDFSVYKSMKDLAPELPGARLHSSLAPAGYELWEKGQLRMPAEGLFLTADLRERGKNDRAILLDVPAGENTAVYILIAGEEGGSWSRLFLQRLREDTQMRWNAERKALEIPSAEGIPVSSSATMTWAPGEAPRGTYGYKFDVKRFAYVRWDGRARRFEYISAVEASFHPWLMRTNLESYGDLSPDELTGVHIRVIRLHPPGESSSLFLFSPGYAPNPDFFEIFRRPHRRGDSRDQNNRTLVLSVSQLREVILALRGLASRQALWERTANNRGMELSVALLRVDEDPRHCEVLLTGPEARSLESVVERITGRRNPFGPAAELIH